MHELPAVDPALSDWIPVGRPALKSRSSAGIPKEPLVLDTKQQSQPCWGGLSQSSQCPS